jgi:hypothetical protein
MHVLEPAGTAETEGEENCPSVMICNNSSHFVTILSREVFSRHLFSGIGSKICDADCLAGIHSLSLFPAEGASSAVLPEDISKQFLAANFQYHLPPVCLGGLGAFARVHPVISASPPRGRPFLKRKPIFRRLGNTQRARCGRPYSPCPVLCAPVADTLAHRQVECDGRAGDAGSGDPAETEGEKISGRVRPIDRSLIPEALAIASP